MQTAKLNVLSKLLVFVEQVRARASFDEAEAALDEEARLRKQIAKLQSDQPNPQPAEVSE